MEEDITCKFLAATTVLKGVFIFLNSIFVRGYFTFFFSSHSKEQPMDELRVSPSANTHFNSSTTFFLGRMEKHLALIQIIATSFTPAKEWTSIRTVMSYTLPQGC